MDEIEGVIGQIRVGDVNSCNEVRIEVIAPNAAYLDLDDVLELIEVLRSRLSEDAS